MSMLSSKCDGLRNAADELQNVIDNAHNYTWPGIVSTLHYAQQGLCDAANIIWGLSCKLADTVDQREEVERLEDENARLRSCLSDDAENAKLRELLKNALTYIEYEGCGVECPETGNSATLTPCDMCNRYETESCAYVIAQSARELGVEVEE